MAVDQDATSGKYVPSTSAQWTELLAGTGLSNPVSLYLFQEASGNAADSIGSKTLTAAGTLAYQQTVSGWSRKSIKTTAGSAGTLKNTTFSNVNANSYTVLLIAQTAAVATQRTLMRFGDTFGDDAVLELTATPRLGVGFGTGAIVTNSVSPISAVNYFWLRIDDSGNQVDAFLNGTKTTGGTQSCNGTELLFGGDNSQTYFPNNTDYMYAAVWASALSDADVATIEGLFTSGPATGIPDLSTDPTVATGEYGLRSGSYKWVAAIEGYRYLLTDATPQQAIDAWYLAADDHGYTEALPGLYVSHDNQGTFDWKVPFPRGGKLTLHIVPDDADTLGIDTHKRNGGAETELANTIDSNDASIVLLDSSQFGASGELFIGNECVEYSANASDTLTVTTRGKYAPALRSTGAGFGHHHRVGEGQLEVLIPTAVNELPVDWIGKWVALHLHKYDPSIPALNSREDSLRAFFGKIVAITDDPATGATVIEVKHALDCAAEATVGGRDQWSGKILNLIELKTGMTFRMGDFIANGTSVSNKTASDLVVVAGAPADHTEFTAGFYTHVEIYEMLNAWLQGESAAANLHGTYNTGYFLPNDNTYRSDIYWTITGTSSSDLVGFELQMPQGVSARLGYSGSAVPSINGFSESLVGDTGAGGSYHSRTSDEPLYRFTRGNGGAEAAITAENEGTFVDQSTSMPASTQPLPVVLSNGWGIFILDNAFLAYGYVETVAATSTVPAHLNIYDLKILPEQYGLGSSFPDNFWRLPWRQDGPDYVSVRQIAVLEMSLGDALLKLFRSTGTTGYNDPTYDTLPYGIGLAFPFEIVDDDTFKASIASLPHVDKAVTLLIDKATRISDLLAGELIVRRAFLRWNNAAGTLEFAQWRSPTESNSLATLNEANKAAPADHNDPNRSVTSEDGTWAAPIVKLQYNRSLAHSPDSADGYRDTLTIVDSAALGNLGGDGPTLTISLRGTFGDFAATGQTADSLAAGFMATMPYFSRPARKTSRSIDQTLYLLSAGDVVTCDDAYARDPDTGQRGVTTRYGILLRHRWSLGGFMVNSDQIQPQGGDVDVFFLDQNRVAAYVPTALVDETQTNAGYDAGTKVLTCYAHKYSESTEAVDASHFPATYKVRIIEVDPANPASPLTWDDTVASQTGNTITLTTGLAGWDNTKRYRVVFQEYSDCVTAQQTKTFQAADDDALVEDLRQSFQYGIGGSSAPFTAWSASDPVELPPNVAYGDGRGRDVGHEVALTRLLNNLVMYKTCVSSPCLNSSEFDPTAVSFGSATWWLIQCRPVKLGKDKLTADCYREVSVAPHFKSLAGASASCRVTLSRTPPTGTSLLDVDRGSIYSSVTFTTTSTTYATPTPQEIDARVKDGVGVAWVYVEINSAAACWGLAHLQETEIEVLHDLVNV